MHERTKATVQKAGQVLVASPVRLHSSSDRPKADSDHHTAPETYADHAARVRVSSNACEPPLTGLHSYPRLVERLGRPNIILLPELQEITNHSCDTGSPRAELEADDELAGLDFSVLDEERHGVHWPAKEGIFDHARILERTLWVRRWLRSRPEDVIVGKLTLSRGEPAQQLILC